jgi:hypothetical protein
MLEKDLKTVRNSLQFSVEENTELQGQLCDARQEMEELSSKLGAVVVEMKAVEDELTKVKEDCSNSLEICSMLFQGRDISQEQEESLKALLQVYLPHIYLYVDVTRQRAKRVVAVAV